MNSLKVYLYEAPFSLAYIRSLELALIEKCEMPQPILDVGAGDGIFGKVLYKSPIAYGIDLDYKELQIAAKSKVYKTLIQASGYGLPFCNDAFASILSNGVLEHVSQVEIVMDEMRRVLKPNGVCIITVPTVKYEENLFFRNLAELFGFPRLGIAYSVQNNKFFNHVNLWDGKKWLSLLQERGFRVADYAYYNDKYENWIEDLGLIFSFSAFLSKKFAGRWILFSWFRRLSAPIALAFMLNLIKVLQKTKGKSESSSLFIKAIKVS